jgi:serine/threonine protein phosphatase PrpC
VAKSLAFGAISQQGEWPCLEDGYFFDPINGVGVVVDGFGGRGAGDISSRWLIGELRAVKASADFLNRARQLGPEAWRRNSSLPVNKRGGCSAIAFQISKGRVQLLCVGAMSVVLVRENQLVSIWSPQALPKEAFQPIFPTEAFGLSESPQLEQRELQLRGGDLLMMGSGGLGWGNDGLLSLLQSQWVLRQPGESLVPILGVVLEAASIGVDGNRTLLGLEGAA